jgi:Protein of unknown function (DUF3040)
MTLIARHHRQLAGIDVDLPRDDPHLARVLTLSPRIGRRGRADLLVALTVNIIGLVVLVVGALLHQTPVVVDGRFLGAGGLLVSVVFRLRDRRRARGVFGQRAVR